MCTTQPSRLKDRTCHIVLMPHSWCLRIGWTLLQFACEYFVTYFSILSNIYQQEFWPIGHSRHAGITLLYILITDHSHPARKSQTRMHHGLPRVNIANQRAIGQWVSNIACKIPSIMSLLLRLLNSDSHNQWVIAKCGREFFLSVCHR